MNGPARAAVAEANRLGITLAVRGGKLVFRPKYRLTPELFQRLKAHKIEVLTILAMSESLPSDGGDSDSAAGGDPEPWPGRRPDWVDCVMAAPTEKHAQSPADDLPPDLRPFAQPEDTGSIGYRRHLARIRRAARRQASVGRPKNPLDSL